MLTYSFLLTESELYENLWEINFLFGKTSQFMIQFKMNDQMKIRKICNEKYFAKNIHENRKDS